MRRDTDLIIIDTEELAMGMEINLKLIFDYKKSLPNNIIVKFNINSQIIIINSKVLNNEKYYKFILVLTSLYYGYSLMGTIDLLEIILYGQIVLNGSPFQKKILDAAADLFHLDTNINLLFDKEKSEEENIKYISDILVIPSAFVKYYLAHMGYIKIDLSKNLIIE